MNHRTTVQSERWTCYDWVRIVLAVILLTAAGLKGHQLATSPITGNGLLNARWFLILTVEFELFFGLWLLAGHRPLATHKLALICFGTFAVVSLYKALTGAASCGCFGRIEVSPWVTFLLDVAAVLALLYWSPTYSHASRKARYIKFRPSAAHIIATWACAGIPVAFAMALYQPTLLTGNGIIHGSGKLVVLEPQKWVGEPLPLNPFIAASPGSQSDNSRLQDRLTEGKWLVVLFHHDCPKCLENMPRYMELGERSSRAPDEPRVVLIEVPTFGGELSSVLPVGLSCEVGRLVADKDWFVQTPVEISLVEGIVTQVSG